MEIVGSIGVNVVAKKRHNGRNRFSYYCPGWGPLTAEVAAKLKAGQYEVGHQAGTYLVRFEAAVDAADFECRGAEMTLGNGWYRRPARSARVVVWDRGALGAEATTDSEFEIVSVEAYP